MGPGKEQREQGPLWGGKKNKVGKTSKDIRSEEEYNYE